ncbi:hypothetical protein DJ90_2827 [Paenibacillus macerans]|uniref:CueP family metal-binding protein n=1 Tax=Paenibacillus macerans TaxID=44252 RepID=A0A090Y2M6_PAEMA|nr:hypothetical protein DJ90_2827 [Paenibacillus macerans]GBK66781.1 hypothetical protein PbJCM17693_04890 [Paenibacillus macerans]GIP08942.1 hypothetical protein J1TS5_11120 [Paenibacillus macerans]
MLAAGVIVVAALGTYYIFTGSAEKEAATVRLDAQSLKQLVHDYSADNLQAQSASITARQLVVTDEGKGSTAYELPEDEFFVSIAPYLEQTHPCEIHSLTSCQGELADQEFDVSIADLEGNTILDQKMKSQANGFIDLWLPRDKTYRITVGHDGKTAESEISTFDSDNTCITTLQLS